jgi:acetolactate synthase-1/2/3 large subunit
MAVPFRTMAESLLQHLKREGVRFVFGIPGGLLHPFFQAVEDDPDLSLVVTRHEQGAAFMADGHFRGGGGLAVVAATSGPGATNLLTGVAVAFSDGVPMLVVTGQAPSRSLGKGAAQETAPEDIDIVGMFRPVTKYSTMITRADRLSHHFRRAMRAALTGRPGPVHLNVPVDLWGQPAEDDWFDPATYRALVGQFDRAGVDRAADALLGARHPLLLVGSGAESGAAREQVLHLVEEVGALVVTTPRGKGVVPEDHPASLGVFGFAGHPQAHRIALGTDVDVLFSLGASLNETTTLNWDPRLRAARTMIQLDIDPERIGRNYPVDVALAGDAATVLMELREALRTRRERGEAGRARWEVKPHRWNDPARFDDPAARASDAVPLLPQRWRADLQAALPDDAILYSDIGGHMLFNLQHLTIRRGQRFLINLGFGSMGHGTVAPIGTALARPGVPVIAIIGDGCFTMSGMEILTAAEYGAKVIWIVENNQMHGITWHGSKLVNGGRPMNCIVPRRPVSVAAMARAMGVATRTVSRPGEMTEALREALGERGPVVIEVLVDGSVAPPLGERAKTVAGFKG